MRHENVIDAIGHSPLIRLKLGSDVAVYAKLELQNLYGMKDRVARQAILAARESGELAAGAPIVESSSGTMALGVALVGAALGHPVHIVTDPRMDEVTLAKLRALGSHVYVVEKMTRNGWQSARLERLDALLADLPGAFCPRQYSNPNNPLAYQALAAELRQDLPHIDILVGTVGSGGSLCGTSTTLRRHLPGLHVVGIDCVGSVLFGQPDWPKRRQSGLGNSLVPPNLDYSVIDEVHWLNDREAFESARQLAGQQQIFAGNTSGSVYRVLRYLSRRESLGTVIVGILADRGDRYYGTVYNDDYWHRSGLLELDVRDQPEPVPMGTVVSDWSYATVTEKGTRHETGDWTTTAA